MKKILCALAALTSSIAFAATTVPVQLLNPTGSSSGQAIVSTGASSAPAWGGVGLNGIAAIGANTLIGNATGSSATPTAVSVTGCNGAAQALQWTNGTGFGCNSSIATSGSNANITALTGLTTPITTAQGGLGANNGSASGVPVFSSGTATVTAVTGSGAPVLANSPTLTGAPAAPTATAGTNTTQIATTAFSQNAVTGGGNPGSFTTLSSSGNDALLYSNTSGQSIPNNSFTTVTGWTKTFDKVNANFSASTGIFTAPATGYYQMDACVTFSVATGVSAAQYAIAFVANAATVAEPSFFQESTASTGVAVCGGVTVSLASGQTAFIQAYQNTGVARSLLVNGGATYLSISRIP
jgi:hypothetical protein